MEKGTAGPGAPTRSRAGRPCPAHHPPALFSPAPPAPPFPKEVAAGQCRAVTKNESLRRSRESEHRRWTPSGLAMGRDPAPTLVPSHGSASAHVGRAALRSNGRARRLPGMQPSGMIRFRPLAELRAAPSDHPPGRSEAHGRPRRVASRLHGARPPAPACGSARAAGPLDIRRTATHDGAPPTLRAGSGPTRPPAALRVPTWTAAWSGTT